MENNEILVNEEEEIVEGEPEIIQAESDFPCGIGWALAGAALGAAGIVGTWLLGKTLKPAAGRLKEKIRSVRNRRRTDEIVDIEEFQVSDEKDSED